MDMNITQEDDAIDCQSEGILIFYNIFNINIHD